VLTERPTSESEVVTVRREGAKDVMAPHVVSLGSDPALRKQIALDQYDEHRRWVCTPTRASSSG